MAIRIVRSVKYRPRLFVNRLQSSLNRQYVSFKRSDNLQPIHGNQSLGPEDVNYYALDLSEDVLGRGEVERSKLEAWVRYYADRFFVSGSANRAILETDLDQSFDYPSTLVNQQDAKAWSATQKTFTVKQLINKITTICETSENKDKDSSKLNTAVASVLAEFYRTTHLTDFAKNMYIAQKLVSLNCLNEAKTVMEIVLVSNETLSTGVYIQFLRLGVRLNDLNWFTKLASAVFPKNVGKAEKFAKKFTQPDFSISNPSIQTLLAKGFAKFRIHPEFTRLVTTTECTPSTLSIYFDAMRGLKLTQKTEQAVALFKKSFDQQNKDNAKFYKSVEKTEYKQTIDEFLADQSSF